MNTATTSLPTGTWTLSPDATTVDVTVKKLKLITVVGNLKVTSGAVVIENGAVASVEAVADAASYDSGNAKRDEHVTTADFLDADNYPTIAFRSNGGTADSIGGEVTIKGKTVPVTFAISNLKIAGESASFTASTSVNRNDLGVDKMPGFVIGRTLDIVINARARLQA